MRLGLTICLKKQMAEKIPLRVCVIPPNLTSLKKMHRDFQWYFHLYR
jgi:hypothetical protein